MSWVQECGNRRNALEPSGDLWQALAQRCIGRTRIPLRDLSTPPKRIRVSQEFHDNYEESRDESLQLPPWEQRETYGWLNGTYLTIKGVLLSPGRFFHRMPSRMGLTQPLLFAVALGVVASFFSWMWALSGSSLQVLVDEDFGHAIHGALYGFLAFLFSPVTVALMVTIKAALIHGVLMLVGGNRLGFEASFRVAAYGEATAILALFPFCGSVVGGFWGLAVTIIGLYSIHETEPWKAVAAVLAPMILCLGATGSAVSLLMLGLR